MKYEKVVCWGADPELQKMVSREFFSSKIALVLTFEDFKKEVTDSSLNLISCLNFNELESRELVFEVDTFAKSQPKLKFHIIMLMNRKGSNLFGLYCGHLEKNKNVSGHMFFQPSTATIQALIDAGL